MKAIVIDAWTHGNIIRGLTHDGARGLFAAIIALAIYDWSHEVSENRVVTRYYHQEGFESQREELEAFWQSEWGEELRDWCDVPWLSSDMLPKGE